MKHSLAATVGVVVVLLAGAAASFLSVKSVATQRVEMQRTLDKIEQNQGEPTVEQLLQAQTLIRVERMDAKLTALQQQLKDKKMGVNPSTAVAQTKKPKAVPTRVVSKPTPTSTSKKPTTKETEAIWTAEAERSRAAWRLWADKELARLRKQNAED